MTGSLAVSQLGQSQSKTSFGSKRKEPGPLDWTYQPFGGAILDIKRRLLPYYASDWIDAFRLCNVGQVLATVFFLFFACVVPAVTFGNLYAKDTNESFGVVETILATAVSGVLYSFTAGQPITILGATGPIFAYTIVVYKMALRYKLEFLPFYFWTLMWTSVISVLMVMFDLCALMRHVTRFSEDIFSGLISMIFIFEAIKPLIANFFDDEKTLPACFLELILWAFTYKLATWLAGLRRTPWLVAQARASLADFGVFIAIVSASALARVWSDIPIDMLEISSSFQPTARRGEEARSWVVSPLGKDGDFPALAIFGAILPAVGFAVLGYLDQNLTTVLVNRPSRKLKKPGGYHLDLLVRALICTPVCAILGLPLAVASTVPSLTHLMSLTRYTVEQLPEGEHKVPESVCEQRLSSLLIHITLGCSLMLANVVGYVPRAVLYGVFLYMGVASLNGNALWERLLLLLIWDVRNFPAFEYAQNVPWKRMHFFTCVQGACLGVLYGLNTFPQTAVIFPFLMASLMINCKFLRNFFTVEELFWLDGVHEDEPDEEEGDGLERQVSPWQQNVEPDLEIPFGRGVTPMGRHKASGMGHFGRGVSTGSVSRLAPLPEI